MREGVTGKARRADPQDALARLRDLPIMETVPNLDDSKIRVALFRAPEDAEGSAARLGRLGFVVARLPVMMVAPLDVSPKRRRYDAVIATSDKAFLADAPVDRASPLFVVGVRTARAAEQRGWRLAAPPEPDSAALIERLEQTLPRGAAVLYLAGRDRKPAIEAALAGPHALEVVDAYAAEARKRWSPAEIRALAECAVALHYSRRSAAIAAALAETAGEAARFRQMTHICLSEDVAKPLEAFGASHIRTAARPDEDRLFTTLIHAGAVFPPRGASVI